MGRSYTYTGRRDDVGVPGTVCDLDILKAIFLLRALAKDVAAYQMAPVSR